MPKSPAVRSSEVAWDGGGIDLFQSGLIAHAVAAVNGAQCVAPFDCDIEEIVITPKVLSAHANAALLIQLGSGAAGSLFSGEDLTNAAAGVPIVVKGADAKFVVKSLTKGQLFQFNTAAADATGSVAAVLVVRPK